MSSRNPVVEFNYYLDTATSPKQNENDYYAVNRLCWMIDEGKIKPADAIQAIHGKIVEENPQVVLHALEVLNTVFYKCGSLAHKVICTEFYMNFLKEIIQTTDNDIIKENILHMLEEWAEKFKYFPQYSAPQKLLQELKDDKAKSTVESDAMFMPDKCHRCTIVLGTFNRKHRCRACGQVFCAQCSSKTSTLPKYGIEKEVRVCDTCYDQVNKPAEYLASYLAQQPQVPPRKTGKELRAEEELQIALALSQSEDEHKDKEKKRVTSAIISNSNVFAKVQNYLPPPSRVQPRKTDEAKSTSRWQNKEVNGLHQARIRNTNGVSKHVKNTDKFDKNRLNETDLELIKSVSNECSNQSNEDFREQEFKKALAEYQQKKKMDYMNYRKSEGLPLFSSDEEDSDNVKKGIKTCQAKQKEGCVPHKSTCLTKELQQVKEQRLRLDSNIQQFRAYKHDEYMQTNNNTATKLKKCSDKNCERCKKSESKDDTEEYRISKRLPYDIRKLVESKQRINNNIEDIKKMKQEKYYTNKRPQSNAEYKPEKMELDNTQMRDSESEDEELRKALLISAKMAKSITTQSIQENVAVKNTPSLQNSDSRLESMSAYQKMKNNATQHTEPFKEMDEDSILQKVLAESKADAGTEENESLQQAINESFAAEEDKNFSSMPKLDEDALIEIAKEMSLNEIHKSQTVCKGNTSSENVAVRLCLVCYETENMMKFMPCNHNCICKGCSEKFTKQQCLLCNKYYEKIVEYYR